MALRPARPSAPPRNPSTCATDVKQAAYSGYLADDLHHPGRRRNLDDHDVAVDQANFDCDDGTVPHIRDPRTRRNRRRG
jgi:hypothetical protein